MKFKSAEVMEIRWRSMIGLISPKSFLCRNIGWLLARLHTHANLRIYTHTYQFAS